MAWKHKLDITRLDKNWTIMVKVAQGLVNRYSARSMALPEDLFQACMIVVPAVLETWDGQRSLATWAWLPLRKAMFVEMRHAPVVNLPEERVLEICRRDKDRKALDKAVHTLSRTGVSDWILDDIHSLQQRLDRADRHAKAPSNLDGIQAMAQDTLLDFEKNVRHKRLVTALRGIARSTREQVVLRKVLCQGLSRHAMARELRVSHTTVNTIVQELLERLHKRLAGKVEPEMDAWEYGDCA